MQEDKALEMVYANIARIRKIRGLTQKQLAEKIGMVTSNFNRIENGNTNPRLSTLNAIATALEVPLYQLFESGDIRELELVKKFEKITLLPDSERQAIEYVLNLALARYESTFFAQILD